MTNSVDIDKLNEILRKSGVLVALTIRRWRGRKQLRPEDLGLGESDINDNLISLGQKRLVFEEDSKEFNLIEGRARTAIDKVGFPFIGLARFVPNKKINSLLQSLEEHQTAFQQATELFCQNYASIRSRSIAAWEAEAQKLPADKRAALIDTIKVAFPSETALPKKFEFSWFTFDVGVPNIQFERQLGTDRVVVAQASQVQLQTNMIQFIDNSVAELRQSAVALCDDILRAIKETGAIHQKTLNRIETFIEETRELNFANDTYLTELLDTFKNHVKDADSYRKDPKALTDFAQQVGTMRTSLLYDVRVSSEKVVSTFIQSAIRSLE